MSASRSARLTSLNARLAHIGQEKAQDPNRLRRQLAFQRLLARLEGTGWVLKGGYCLEIRLADRSQTVARTTKDIDFVTRTRFPDEDAVLDEVERHLTSLGDDGFSFEAHSAERLRASDDPSGGWRIAMEAFVDGHTFTRFKLDLMAQFDELAEAVEPLVVASPVRDVTMPSVEVPAVDVYQHAAEKFHAMGRIYAGERPSSRVKDLADLVLLLDAGLLTDLERLASRIIAVNQARDGASPPGSLPDPPDDWAERYASMASDLHLAPATSAEAFDRIHDLYQQALERNSA